VFLILGLVRERSERKPLCKHLNIILLVATCASLLVSGDLKAAGPPAPDQQDRPPRPIEPPHKPVQAGTRLAVVFGLNLFSYGQYAYNTTVTLPNGSTFPYAGKQSASGGSFLTGAAVTPPGAFRRLTAGFTLNLGGLASWTHTPIPNGVTTPFSQSNLSNQIQRNAIFGYGWQPAISPYVEHELGFLLESRVRAGYQYWHQRGSYSGSFSVDQPGSALANYNVRVLHSSHLLRLSINNHTSLDDETSPSRKQNPGFLRQGGLLVGTNHTVMLFIALGPDWTF
jgi:hypothetical protein